MFAQNAAKQVKVNGFGNAAVKAGLAICFVKVAVAAERQYRQMRVTLFDLPATALSILSTQPVAIAPTCGFAFSISCTKSGPVKMISLGWLVMN
jgi:hypothetical protein